MRKTRFDRIIVRSVPGSPGRGQLVAGGMVFPCALGRSGIRIMKREGDGATPEGRYRPLGAFWRSDRQGRPSTSLRLAPIGKASGWCDDPLDRNYNKPVDLPYAASAETMRREDGLYDLVVDLDWNRGPIAKGKGSAIFVHVAAPGYGPTEGCIALSRGDLRKLLARVGRNTVFDVRR
jgi:L,D-peptidoglycan transpeptidase YkuD (ErfK/YbiS/YcfS/YnhG family)